MTIVHLKLGKITKRSDGRYQAGYRDVDGKRKFITCNSEEEVLERFQALQLAQEKVPESEKKPGRQKTDVRAKTNVNNPIPKGAQADDYFPLADYMLNWLEKFKKGKIRPSSYEPACNSFARTSSPKWTSERSGWSMSKNTSTAWKT